MFIFFFFQAEDGIRDLTVTGVQTCALPILALPYDSEEGRDMSGAVTALMCGEAYAQSSRIAERMGPFAGYEVNREPMLDVIRMHREAMRGIEPKHVQPELFMAAQESWDTALTHGEK